MPNDVPMTIVRERLVGALYAARDHDAFWARPDAGSRTPTYLAITVGRGRHVPTQTVMEACEELRDQGLVERAPGPSGEGWRWREPVVPVGGEERMAQA
ncbi:MarR family transcriptional regulator [Miltoncostaea marina]|uniref:MarR family transcriptional regulator n=1 Tax=Miltoncostaea marina TaxID=2843215 RepID=UPI001C3E30E1|nr:helix-turn-helix domain-containing protein [Miltoncostaea marina]